MNRKEIVLAPAGAFSAPTLIFPCWGDLAMQIDYFLPLNGRISFVAHTLRQFASALLIELSKINKNKTVRITNYHSYNPRNLLRDSVAGR